VVEIPGHGYKDPTVLLGFIPLLIFFFKLSDPREILARKNRLIDKTVSHTEIQNVLLESILLPSVFVISILISIVDLQIAYYFWMVIIPAKIIIGKRYP
jgi:hypothetical protein